MGSWLACLFNSTVEELRQNLLRDVLVRLHRLVPHLPATDGRAQIEAVHPDHQRGSRAEVDDVVVTCLVGPGVHNPEVHRPGLARGDVELSHAVVQAQVLGLELALRLLQIREDDGGDPSRPARGAPTESWLAALGVNGGLQRLAPGLRAFWGTSHGCGLPSASIPGLAVSTRPGSPA